MRIASYRGEASVADLVSRLFPSSTKQKAIGQMLLKTNPHLADLASVQPGTPILIPDGLPASTEAKALNPYAELVAQRVASQSRRERRSNAVPEVAPAVAPDEEKAAKPRRSRRTSRKKK